MSEISHCRAGPPSGQSQRAPQYQDSQGLGYCRDKGRHSEHANHAHEGKTESVPQSAIQLAEARVRAAAAGAEIHQARAMIVSPCLPYCSWSRMIPHQSRVFTCMARLSTAPVRRGLCQENVVNDRRRSVKQKRRKQRIPGIQLLRPFPRRTQMKGRHLLSAVLLRAVSKTEWTLPRLMG